ncbi:MAG: VRR-NUC domain-containing protein [Acutalibacteraceae bacterium]|nr:VRR-NUC domain-containing protein [Acutalibacteraceae bacterium]
MTEEHRIQNQIRIALAEYCVIFRINVGKVKTPDGRYFDTGVPTGFSDLFGLRKSDGKAVFIEVKTKTGKPTLKQKQFIQQMKLNGAIAGICRSADEAINLVKEI